VPGKIAKGFFEKFMGESPRLVEVGSEKTADGRR
jgi:hypothetical protein